MALKQGGIFIVPFAVTRGLRFRCLMGRTAHLVALYNKQRTLRTYSYPGCLRYLDRRNILQAVILSDIETKNNFTWLTLIHSMIQSVVIYEEKTQNKTKHSTPLGFLGSDLR